MEYLKLVSFIILKIILIDIDIREYFRLPFKIREVLVGFDSDYNEIDISLKNIVLKILWIFFRNCNEYEDYRFQLFDGTVVHNSTLKQVF